MLLCCTRDLGDRAAADDQRRVRHLGRSTTRTWKLFAYAPLKDMLPDVDIDSPSYVAVWIADDPAETDDDPLADTNGTSASMRRPTGRAARTRSIEVTVARTSGTEIERGQIAQRGQEELNQRSRKAAVQTPGKALTNSRLNTSTGNLVVQ